MGQKTPKTPKSAQNGQMTGTQAAPDVFRPKTPLESKIFTSRGHFEASRAGPAKTLLEAYFEALLKTLKIDVFNVL